MRAQRRGTPPKTIAGAWPSERPPRGDNPSRYEDRDRLPLRAGLALFDIRARGPAFPGLRAEILEAACRDRLAHAAHQVLVIMQVDAGEQHPAQDLIRLDQVMQIGAGIIPRRRAIAVRVERTRIV